MSVIKETHKELAPRVDQAHKQEVVFQLKQTAEHQKTATQDVLLMSEDYANPLEKTKKEKVLEKLALPSATEDAQKGARALLVDGTEEEHTTQNEQSISLIALIAQFSREMAQCQSSNYNMLFTMGNAQLHTMITMTPLMQTAINNQFDQQSKATIDDAQKAEIQGALGITGFVVGTGLGFGMHLAESSSTEETIQVQKQGAVDTKLNEVNEDFTTATAQRDQLTANGEEVPPELTTKIRNLEQEKLEVAQHQASLKQQPELERNLKRAQQRAAELKRTNAPQAQREAAELEVENAKATRDGNSATIKAGETRMETKDPKLGAIKRAMPKLSSFIKGMKKITEVSQWVTPLTQGVGMAWSAQKDRDKADRLVEQGSFTAMSEGLKMVSQTLQQFFQRSEATTGQAAQSFESATQLVQQLIAPLVSAYSRS